MPTPATPPSMFSQAASMAQAAPKPPQGGGPDKTETGQLVMAVSRAIKKLAKAYPEQGRAELEAMDKSLRDFTQAALGQKIEDLGGEPKPGAEPSQPAPSTESNSPTGAPAQEAPPA